ncbi:hypothetical protein BJ165DRAFT_1525749 [Panaeolus papilionaceus]|nr:hypothetical protein BJ165DRAFT_1525749 [Panaeolus papilionaceus]
MGRVSSGCLHLARKAIFTTHTVQLYADWHRDSLAFLQSFPDIVPYIQQLKIDLDIPAPSSIGEAATFLRQIECINRLRITTTDPDPGQYSYSYTSDFPPYKDLVAPILEIQALKELELVVDLGFGFRFTSQHVLYIHLSGCPGADIEFPSHPLKEASLLAHM